MRRTQTVAKRSLTAQGKPFARPNGTRCTGRWYAKKAWRLLYSDLSESMLRGGF